MVWSIPHLYTMCKYVYIERDRDMYASYVLCIPRETGFISRIEKP